MWVLERDHGKAVRWEVVLEHVLEQGLGDALVRRLEVGWARGLAEKMVPDLVQLLEVVWAEALELGRDHEWVVKLGVEKECGLALRWDEGMGLALEVVLELE